MRIISGKFKGHKLVSFDEDHIRPTTDRVKESVFNIIAASLPDSRVLDLFSGTGNLGLEALSREAQSIDMVEINPRSIAIIRKNLERLKVTEGAKIIKADAVKFTQEYSGEPYDIILIDPPFPLKIGQKILESIGSSQVANGSSQIIIEHAKQEPLPDEIGSLRLIDSRSYGDKIVSFYKKKDEE